MGTSKSIWFLAFSLGLMALPRAVALPTPDPDNGAIELPPGFRALVVADNLGALRFMTVAPNGDIYLKRTDEGITALRDTKGDGRADVIQNFGEDGGTGIAVRDGWLYYSTNIAVYRYKLNPGELVPSSEPENIVTDLPSQQEHESKAFAFDPDGNLYVEVGCPSNSSGEPDRAYGAKGVDPAPLFARHGGFWRFKSDVPYQDQMKDGVRYGYGFRHILAIAWQPIAKAFFTVQMGRDQLNTVDPQDFSVEQNAELPAEEMHELTEKSNFGWPFTYYDPLQKARMISPEFGGDGHKRATPGQYDDPLVAFPAHWAPMQMVTYTGTQFPAKYRNGMFVAFHGSWNRAPLPQAGYNVTFVPFNEQGQPVGTYEVFADNFKGQPVIMSPAEARFRPCGLAQGPDGSLYVSDSEKGRVWRIIYTGENVPTTPPPTASAAPKENASSAAPESDALAAGAKVYMENCASCHQVDGSGVPNMQPALKGDAVVAGDPGQLIQVVLQGPAAVLPANRPHYANAMPPFARLSDEDLAALLTYLRQHEGNGASAVKAKDVAAARGLAPAPSP
jgi:glucose/arabinose dehydrogenase/mono/diheme cytochrome c family protein